MHICTYMCVCNLPNLLIVEGGSWFEYTQEWWKLAMEYSNILVVTYEDLKQVYQCLLSSLIIMHICSISYL